MIASLFVGRQRELGYLRKELSAGRSVVLTGPFGIGRTSLVRHAAEEMGRVWAFVFADLEKSPGEAWRELFAALFPRVWERQQRRGEVRSAQWTRYRVLHRRSESRRPHVVVLDNVARLSAPRLDFVRRLREAFQVVAIVEDFLPEDAKAVLCVLGMLSGLALDGRSAALLCGRTYASPLLVENLATWAATPPPVIAHLLKQPIVRQSPRLKLLLRRHPNCPRNIP